MVTERPRDTSPWVRVGMQHATELTDLVPRTKADCQRVLRQFGYTCLKINTIEEPEYNGGGVETRIYALTSPVLHEDGEMRRSAKTIVLRITQDVVTASARDGWVVE